MDTSEEISSEESSLETSSENSTIEESSSEEDGVFTITYNVNSPNDSIAIVNSRTHKVRYGESFTLQTPNCPGYVFLYWAREGENTPFQQSTYLFEEDITLVAQWELNTEDSFWWTENG